MKNLIFKKEKINISILKNVTNAWFNFEFLKFLKINLLKTF